MVAVVAAVLAAWDSSCSRLSKEDEHIAEAKAARITRMAGLTEYQNMRNSYRTLFGKLSDKITPSRALLGSKLEQVEENEPRVEDMKEVTSRDDGEESGLLTSTMDYAGRVHMKKGFKTILPPSKRKIRSARITVASRCAMTIEVRSFMRASSAA